MRLMKNVDPNFAREAFDRELREYIMPEVVDAHLSADQAALKAWLLLFRNAKTRQVVGGGQGRVEQCTYFAAAARAEGELGNKLTGGWKYSNTTASTRPIPSGVHVDARVHSYNTHLPSQHAPHRTRLRLPMLRQPPTRFPSPSSPPTSATWRERPASSIRYPLPPLTTPDTRVARGGRVRSRADALNSATSQRHCPPSFPALRGSRPRISPIAVTNGALRRTHLSNAIHELRACKMEHISPLGLFEFVWGRGRRQERWTNTCTRIAALVALRSQSAKVIEAQVPRRSSAHIIVDISPSSTTVSRHNVRFSTTLFRRTSARSNLQTAASSRNVHEQEAKRRPLRSTSVLDREGSVDDSDGETMRAAPSRPTPWESVFATYCACP
ncbi:hypothetical protein DFH08DRAFT_1089450 [Mycena albidolilacea]|uniref:Uncharacterized protein n=1 Tax=Mycena albidolilacea TaxID=1033008 RepID=A0AAD6Z1B1_9AGAR|nr:hypothetical protein DFH08DRAFT_1089450 [Mycena albidolilacea]